MYTSIALFEYYVNILSMQSSLALSPRPPATVFFSLDLWHVFLSLLRVAVVAAVAVVTTAWAVTVDVTATVTAEMWLQLYSCGS